MRFSSSAERPKRDCAPARSGSVRSAPEAAARSPRPDHGVDPGPEPGLARPGFPSRRSLHRAAPSGQDGGESLEVTAPHWKDRSRCPQDMQAKVSSPGTGGGGVGGLGGKGCRVLRMIELASASIADLGAALRSGRVRAVDLIGQATRNRDESLGAYKLWAPERAAAAAAMADAAFRAGPRFRAAPRPARIGQGPVRARRDPHPRGHAASASCRVGAGRPGGPRRAQRHGVHRRKDPTRSSSPSGASAAIPTGEPRVTRGAGKSTAFRAAPAPGRASRSGGHGDRRARQRHRRFGARAGELYGNRRAQDHLRALVARRAGAAQSVPRQRRDPDPVGRGCGARVFRHRPPMYFGARSRGPLPDSARRRRGPVRGVCARRCGRGSAPRSGRWRPRALPSSRSRCRGSPPHGRSSPRAVSPRPSSWPSSTASCRSFRATLDPNVRGRFARPSSR